LFVELIGHCLVQGRGLGPNVEAFRWSTCLPFFGTTVYSMEGISMIIPIEQSMKKKEDLPKVCAGR
jgi:amino acid permease